MPNGLTETLAGGEQPKIESDGTERGSRATLRIQDSLTIEHAPRWREELLKLFSSATDVVIDVSATDRVDYFGLQLLCSARKTAEAAGRRVHLIGCGANLAAVCDAAGTSLSEVGGVSPTSLGSTEDAK